MIGLWILGGVVGIIVLLWLFAIGALLEAVRQSTANRSVERMVVNKSPLQHLEEPFEMPLGEKSYVSFDSEGCWQSDDSRLYSDLVGEDKTA